MGSDAEREVEELLQETVMSLLQAGTDSGYLCVCVCVCARARARLWQTPTSLVDSVSVDTKSISRSVTDSRQPSAVKARAARVISSRLCAPRDMGSNAAKQLRAALLALERVYS